MARTPGSPVLVGSSPRGRGTHLAPHDIGDAKQLDAADAGKPFTRLQAAGMPTDVMDGILRQRDPARKEAVEASLKGEIGRAFEKLETNLAEFKPDDIAGAVAARWLKLSPEERENTGIMAPTHELRRAIAENLVDRVRSLGIPVMKAVA